MRSMLFVPGDSRKKLEKAFACGADALFVDLEDSVAAPQKAKARAAAAAFIIEARRGGQTGPKLFVRVNGLDTGLADADLDAVMPARPDGVVLPKACGGRDVQHLGAKLAVREAENGLDDGYAQIIAIATETAKSLFELGTFAGSTRRLAGLTWGSEDLSADLGAETNRTPEGLLTPPFGLVRSLALFAAAAAGVPAFDQVYANFRDMAGLRRECEEARRDGFSGKMAIHPAQAAVINEIFTPPAQAIERARKIVAAFAADPSAGVIGLDGEMLDKPHLERARRLLARAS